MKDLILVFLFFNTFNAFSQSNRAPKMSPIYADGYFVTLRNDTVRGEIQINPQNETDFYKQFYFRKKGTKKARPYNAQRAKAYMVEGKNYVMATIDDRKLFIERLVSGRLNFYEYRHKGKLDGYAAIESAYFIKDTDPEQSDVDLKELRKISSMFYKKFLKPYMKDQPMIWKDLDKYNFDEQSVVSSIIEFNTFYASVSRGSGN